jgi:hypothetical protein
MKTTMTIPEAYTFKSNNPSCVLILSGDTAEVLTGEDIPEDMKSTRLIPVQSFRERFTKVETTAFLSKSITDANVQELNFKLATATEPLDLDGVNLQQGMLYLVSVGVISDARRIEILS